MVNSPQLHPYAVALVAGLIEEGRVGKYPFGVPLAVWKAEIVKHPAGLGGEGNGQKGSRETWR